MGYVDIKEHPITKVCNLDFDKDIFAESDTIDFLKTFDIGWKLGQGKYTALALYTNYLYHKTGKKVAILMHDSYALTMQRLLIIDAGFMQVNVSHAKGLASKVEAAIKEPKAKVFIMTKLRWEKLKDELMQYHPDVGYVATVSTNKHFLTLTKLGDV